MKNFLSRVPFALAIVWLSAACSAAEPEPQAQGNATITVGDDTATWPVWRCAKRLVLAHQLPHDDIRVDHHVKLIDYGDVIQLVLHLEEKNYVADIPATNDLHSLDYEGVATRINPVTFANDGEARFSLRVQCNP
ncbi:MAG: hypothetical protein AB8G16_15885 [Gammaproteobacteria bacterium]